MRKESGVDSCLGMSVKFFFCWFVCLLAFVGLLVNFFVFVSKMNGILDCTERIVVSRFWLAAVPCGVMSGVFC